MLDTTRLRGILAQQLNVPPTQVSAMMLGEHGDSMVAIWSAAQIAGLPLDKWPGVSPTVIQEVEKRTRGSGAEVIKKKTGAGFAVGVSIAEVIHSIALDRRRILPISTLQTGTYGIRDVCLSVPTVVGRVRRRGPRRDRIVAQGADGPAELREGPPRDDRQSAEVIRMKDEG